MTLSERSNGQMATSREQYRADGVLIVRQIFTEHERQALIEGWTFLKARIEAGVIERSARFVSGSPPEPLASIYRSKGLVNAAKILLGTEDVALYLNRLLLKDAAWSGAVSLHQDMPYFSGGLEKLSVFVPLTPTKARNGNGGLIFLKGSHKYGNLRRGTIRREVFPPMEEVAPDLDVGDVALADFLTWHYSDGAAMPADRPLLQIAYQPATDGSYSSYDWGGVPEPTLVSGQWRTQHFAGLVESTLPDV